MYSITNIKKNGIVHVCRDIKTEKSQEQDWDGNLASNHFHITTPHKYHFFVFYFCSGYEYTHTYVGLLCGSG